MVIEISKKSIKMSIIFHYESADEEIKQCVLEYMAKWIIEELSKYTIAQQNEVYRYIEAKLSLTKEPHIF